jgi:hypothetical protein
MAAGMKFDDRASQAVTAPGNSNFNFTGAITRQGAISFDTFMTTTGDYTTYEADNGTAWETGYITKQANGTYARTVKRSTNGNAAVNFSTGTVSVSCDLPAWLLDHLNLIEEILASAATTDLGSIQSKCIELTGTTGITSFGNGKNKERYFRYTGAGLTITTGSTLVCLGAVNLTLATGDIGCAVSDNTATPIWRILWVRSVSGNIAGATVSGAMVATQTNQESASATNLIVTPGAQQFHPSAAKCWGFVTVSGGTPTLAASFNVTSITDTGVGRLTVTIATDFSSGNYVIQINSGLGAGVTHMFRTINGQPAGSFEQRHFQDGLLADPSDYHFVCYGDQ